MFQVLPSLLAFNKQNPYQQLKTFLENGFNFIHYDVMDGIYVVNQAYEFEHLDWMKNNGFKYNIHLMVNNPVVWVKQYFQYKPQGISYHFETLDFNTNINLIKSIQQNHIKAGIAIHPYTSLDQYQHLLKHVDFITFMSVVPGKGGQLFLSDAKQRLQEIVAYKKNNNLNFLIEIDGGINKDKIIELNEYVDLFVSGTGLIKEIDNLKEFKKAINLN